MLITMLIVTKKIHILSVYSYRCDKQWRLVVLQWLALELLLLLLILLFLVQKTKKSRNTEYWVMKN